MAENAKEALASGGDAAASAASEDKNAPEFNRRRSSTPKAGAAAADDDEKDSDEDDGFEDASSLGGNHDSPRSDDIKIPTAKITGPGDANWVTVPRRREPLVGSVDISKRGKQRPLRGR